MKEEDAALLNRALNKLRDSLSEDDSTAPPYRGVTRSVVLGIGRNAMRPLDTVELLEQAIAALEAEGPDLPYVVRDVVVDIEGGWITLYLAPNV